MELPVLTQIRREEEALPSDDPALTPDEVQLRVDAFRTRLEGEGCDCGVVYGDRENFANLYYLTGHDPRFEEAVLVVPSGGPIHLIVGNEGEDYSRWAALTPDVVLAQSLSLPGQDRDAAPNLSKALSRAGVRPGTRVGLVGWKCFLPTELDGARGADTPPYFAAPQYVCAALQEAATTKGSIVDVTDHLIDPDHGLRAVKSAREIVRAEYRAARASHYVREALDAADVGVSEHDLIRAMDLDGEPLTCHPMAVSGAPADYVSLRSPTTRRLEQGDPVFVAIGLRGGLTARTGVVLTSDQLFQQGHSLYQAHFEELVRPYYCLTKRWYESIRVGVSAGEVYDAVEALLRDMPFELALNPGHLTGPEEWLHSPFFAGSRTKLRTGMVIQCDMIPVGRWPTFTANAEDTLALADAAAREEITLAYPAFAERVKRRRAFMEEKLGIKLHEDVLPLASYPALFTPYLLSPEVGLSFA